jgi:hypothetical protein
MFDLTGTRDTVLTALKTLCAAQVAGYPIYYDNGPQPDLDKVGSEFLHVSLRFEGSEQADMGLDPVTRVDGVLNLMFMQKELTGTRQPLLRADVILEGMKQKYLSAVLMGTPHPGRYEAHDGWSSQEWNVPFVVHYQ